MIALALAACAADPPAGPPTTDDTSDSGTPAPTDGACAADATDALGEEPLFDAWSGEILLRRTPDYTELRGALLDGPPVRFQVETDRIGQCRLETYAPSLCDPGCTGEQICREESCVDLPHRLEGGTLTLEGSSAARLVAEPDGTRGYYAYTYEPLEGPLVLEGSGGPDVPAFAVTGCPVDPPRPSEDWSALLEARGPGEDAVLSWQGPDPEARIRIRMTTGTATHGGIAHAEISCEGPDTGSLILPGAFLDALYSDGWGCGECGVNELIRYRSTSIGETGAAFTSEGAAGFYFRP